MPVLLLVVVVSGCGGGSGGGAHARARAGGAATPSSCADRLPLDTLLDVPDGPRGPRPLILALHGARQGGYGMQRYTGLSDDARDFVVAYPNTPHDNGFWRVEDVPRLLALVDAIGRCVPVTGVTHLRWRDCDDGTRVEHLRVAGDTHGWPALLDANERMVRFLRAAG